MTHEKLPSQPFLTIFELHSLSYDALELQKFDNLLIARPKNCGRSGCRGYLRRAKQRI